MVQIILYLILIFYLIFFPVLKVSHTPPELKPKVFYNELGKVLVLEYHKLGEREDRWTRSYENFKKDLERLYKSGYRLISVSDFFINKNINIPAGCKPLIITFDDLHPSQLKFTIYPLLEPNCAVAMMDEFYRQHPDFGRTATFFVNFPVSSEKLIYLNQSGREIGNHTYHHKILRDLKETELIQEITLPVREVRKVLGDSYVMNALALPDGIHPKTYKGKKLLLEEHKVVFLVGSGPTLPSYHLDFDPLYVQRIQATDEEINKWFSYAETHPEELFVSDGDPNTITVQEADRGMLNESMYAKRQSLTDKGIYLTFYSASLKKRMEEIVSELQKWGGNTVVIDIKDESGKIGWKLDLQEALSVGAEVPYVSKPKELVDYLHREGIWVVGRITVFKDQILPKKRPDLAIKNRLTGKAWVSPDGALWTDPFSDEVVDYNLKIAEAAAKIGVDEIQFDYVRFPERGRIENCQFNHNKNGNRKYKAIEKFLIKAGRRLRPYRVSIGADLFGVIAWEDERDIENTGQRLEEIAKYVDLICPMLYPSHFDFGFDGHKNPADSPYYFINTGLKKTLKLTEGSGVKIIPWLQGFGYRVKNFNENYILEQRRAVEDLGLKNFLVWDANNRYEVAFKALEKPKLIPGEQSSLP